MKLFLASINTPYELDHDLAWFSSGPFLVKAENTQQVVEKLRPLPNKEFKNEQHVVYVGEIQDQEVILIPGSVLEIKGYEMIKVW